MRINAGKCGQAFKAFPCNRGARCVEIEGRGVAAIEDRGVSRSRIVVSRRPRIAVCHARGSRIAVYRDAAIEDRGVANNYKRPKFCPVRRSIPRNLRNLS